MKDQKLHPKPHSKSEVCSTAGLQHCSTGFSLIELVFAMTFLTIIILGVVTLQSSNLAMMNSEKNRTQAEFLANEGVQIAKAVGGLACAIPCDKKIIPGDSYSLAELNGEPERVSVGTQDFLRTIRSSKIDLLTNAYQIKAIVEWEDSAGPHTLAEGSQVEASLIISQ